MKYPRALFTGAALAVSCTLIGASSMVAADDAKSDQAAPAKAPAKAKAGGKAEQSKPATAAAKPKAPAAADVDTGSTDKEKADADADAAKVEAGADKDAETSTHTVKAAPFELDVEIDGTFESTRMTEIALSPEAWSDLTVVETVAHGALVKKGDVLVKLKTDDLKDQIRELELARPGDELALKIAEEEFAALESSTPLQLKAAREAKTRAEQDLVYYEKVTKPQSIDSAHWVVKSSEFSLEYNQEELDQLRKMYAADDLTEETEEIIVKRAEYSVESSKRSLESTRRRSERSLTTTIPREHADQRQQLEQQIINWKKAESTLPETLKKARLDLAAQRRGLDKSAEKLSELKSDLAAMTITAPHDGVAYYGAATRGKWLTTANIEKKLRPSGKLMPHEVILTVVQTSPLQIRTAVGEAQLPNLEIGQSAQVTPTSNPEAKLDAKLKTLSYVPLAGNTFDAVFSMTKKPVARLFPGMTCKLKIELYKNPQALTVPKAAVKGEGKDRHVILADGKKRAVTVGKSNDKHTEIISGLKEGDVVKTK